MQNLITNYELRITNYLIIQQPLLAVFALRGRIEVFGDKSISSHTLMLFTLAQS
jgi:hypothetical protein